MRMQDAPVFPQHLPGTDVRPYLGGLIFLHLTWLMGGIDWLVGLNVSLVQVRGGIGPPAYVVLAEMSSDTATHLARMMSHSAWAAEVDPVVGLNVSLASQPYQCFAGSIKRFRNVRHQTAPSSAKLMFVHAGTTIGALVPLQCGQCYSVCGQQGNTALRCWATLAQQVACAAPCAAASRSLINAAAPAVTLQGGMMFSWECLQQQVICAAPHAAAGRIAGNIALFSAARQGGSPCSVTLAP
jgi:hypothetical protein